MDVKSEVLLRLFKKSKLSNGTKMLLEPKFFSIYSQIQEIRVYSATLKVEYVIIIHD